MPLPLWEDAKQYLLMQGAPISTFNLNNAMNELAANPKLRPSYGGGPTNDMVANMGGGNPIQSSGDLGVLTPSAVSPMAAQDTFDDRRAVNALAVPRAASGRSNAPSPVARNAPATPMAKPSPIAPQASSPPLGAPGSEPDIGGGAPPGPNQAMASTGSTPTMPGSGSDSIIGNIMDWVYQNGAKLAAGAGLVAGGAGIARMLGPSASAGMRPRNAPGLGIGQGLPGTAPGGGPGSGFMGAMPSGPGANPLTGTLPLGSAGGGGLAPSVTMPLPPPTVSMPAYGNVPMGPYGPVQQTGVVPSGPPMSVPPDVINQGGPDIAGLLSGPRNVTKDAQGPSAGGRIRSPRARTASAPEAKPSSRGRPTSKSGPSMLEMMNIKRDKGTPAPKRTKGGKTAADADQNDARIKRNRAAQNRSR